MRPPQRDLPAKKALKHPVFRPDGSVFYADEPAHNQETAWVWQMCRAVRDEYLTPLMVVVQHARLHAPLLQPVTILAWGEIDRFHLWPLAGANSSLERTIMQQGRSSPPWLDDKAWGWACDAAEKKWGHASRFEGIDLADPAKIFQGLVKTMPDVEFDNRMRAEAERQLEAAKAVGLL